MPLVQMPYRNSVSSGRDFQQGWRPLSATYTGRWLVQMMDDSGVAVTANGVAVQGLAVNASMLGEDYPYPSRNRAINVLATNDNPRGCTVTVGAPFIIDAPLSVSTFQYRFYNARTVAAPGTFQYPDEWDDAPSSGSYPPPGWVLPEGDELAKYNMPYNGYLVFVEMDVTFYGPGSPYVVRAFIGNYSRRLDIIDFGYGFNLDKRITDPRLNGPEPYKDRYLRYQESHPDDTRLYENYFFSESASWDEASLSIQPTFPIADNKIPGFGLIFLKPVVTPPLPRQTVVAGTAWTAPPEPTVTTFLWDWGDGATDEVDAGVTGYEFDSDVRDPETYIGHLNGYYSASSMTLAEHIFEDFSESIRVRAIDSYGRRSPWYTVGLNEQIPLSFSGDAHYSTAHNAHGELFAASVETDRDMPQGVHVLRSATTIHAARPVSFIPGAKSPRLFFDGANRLHISVLEGASNSWAVYSTSDCGESWE